MEPNHDLKPVQCLESTLKGNALPSSRQAGTTSRQAQGFSEDHTDPPSSYLQPITEGLFVNCRFFLLFSSRSGNKSYEFMHKGGCLMNRRILRIRPMLALVIVTIVGVTWIGCG